MKKLLLTLLLLLSLGFAASAQMQDELVNTNFTGMSYTKAVQYTSSNGAKYEAQASSNSGFQLRTSKAGTGLTVLTAPEGYVVSTIEVTMGRTGGGVNVYAADEAINLSAPGSAVDATGELENKIFDINKRYFAITATNDTYCIVSKVVVNWVPEGGDDRSEVSLAWSETELNLNIGEAFVAPTLSATIEGVESEEAKAAVVLTSSNEELLSVADGQIVMNEGVKGIATITASIPATNDTFKAQSAEFTLTVVDPNSSETIFDFSTFEWSNQKEISTVDKDIVTLAFDKGSNSNTPKYFTKGNDVRLYGGGTLTISVPEGYVITKIESVYNNTNNDLAANSGEFNNDYTLWTATEDVNSVVFTESGTSGNRSWTSIKVYYAKANGKAAAGLAFAETAYTTYTGEEFTAPVLSNPNNLTVAWTSSNEEVATVDAEGKVTVKGLGTTTIAAASEETEEFRAGSASYTLTVVAAARSIAEMKTLAPEEGNGVRVNCELTVVYSNGLSVYVVDANKDAALLYGTNTYSAGDVIPAGYDVYFKNYNGLPEWTLKETSMSFPESISNIGAPEYDAVDAVSNDDVNKVLVIRNVKFADGTLGRTDADKADNFTGVLADGTELTFRTNWAIEAKAAGFYNVTVAVGYYENASQATLQLYPISYEQLPATITATDGVTVFENGDINELKYGAVVTFAVENAVNYSAIVNDENVTFENGSFSITITEDTYEVMIDADGEIAEYGFIMAETAVKGLEYEITKKAAGNFIVSYTIYVDNHKDGKDEYVVKLNVEGVDEFTGEHSLVENPAGAPMREAAQTTEATHKFAGAVVATGLAEKTPYNMTLSVEHNGTLVAEHTKSFEGTTTTLTGIDDVTVDGNEEAEYFNLQGVRVAQPEAGQVYIVRRGAKVAKELVK